MEITDVRVRMVSNSRNTKAVASITIDDAFVVHDIKVLEGKKGLFVAMPSRKASDGDYKDIAHPIQTSVREHISEMVLNAYNKHLSEGETETDEE